MLAVAAGEERMKACISGLLLLGGLTTASPAAAHPPYGLAADPAGNVYFSDLETVWRFSWDGRLSVFRPAVPGRHVHALALAPDGAIEGDENHYDTETQRFYTGLWRRTLAGAERNIVQMAERPPPGAGVWQDKYGNRYATQWISAADRRTVLLRRRADGRVDVLFDETGGAAHAAEHSAESVGGMAIDGEGSLFFASRNVLRRVAPNGTVTTIYKGPAGSSLRGVAVAPNGRALASDSGERKVLAVSPNGDVELLYQEKAGWLPTAVAVAADRLLVLEANDDPYERKDRVRVIEVRNGQGIVVAAPAHRQALMSAAPAPPPIKSSWPSTRTILLGSLTASAAALAACWFRARRAP